MKPLTYDERKADNPEREESTVYVRQDLEISEYGVQLDRNGLQQKDGDASQGDNDRSVDGEKDAKHRFLDSKVGNVISSAVPVHGDTAWVVVLFQSLRVEVLVPHPVLLSSQSSNVVQNDLWSPCTPMASFQKASRVPSLQSSRRRRLHTSPPRSPPKPRSHRSPGR